MTYLKDPVFGTVFVVNGMGQEFLQSCDLSLSRGILRGVSSLRRDLNCPEITSAKATIKDSSSFRIWFLIMMSCWNTHAWFFMPHALLALQTKSARCFSKRQEQPSSQLLRNERWVWAPNVHRSSRTAVNKSKRHPDSESSEGQCIEEAQATRKHAARILSLLQKMNVVLQLGAHIVTLMIGFLYALCFNLKELSRCMYPVVVLAHFQLIPSHDSVKKQWQEQILCQSPDHSNLESLKLAQLDLRKSSSSNSSFTMVWNANINRSLIIDSSIIQQTCFVHRTFAVRSFTFGQP